MTFNIYLFEKLRANETSFHHIELSAKYYPLEIKLVNNHLQVGLSLSDTTKLELVFSSVEHFEQSNTPISGTKRE